MRREWPVAREIVVTTLRQELRRPRGGGSTRGKLGALISSVIVYVFAGFLTAMSLARGLDPYTGLLFSTTVFMLLVAIFVVMEFGTLVTGPDDLGFYLPLPVAPRTYVAAKIGVTCLFGFAFSFAYALPALIILPATGGSAVTLLTLVASLIDGGLIACLLVTTLLGLAVRFISYKRVREVAAWAQFAIFIAVYGGYFIFQRSFSGAGITRLEITPLLLLAPSAWAPSLLRLGEGGVAAIGVCLAVGVPIALFLAAVPVISAAYGGKLADASGSVPRAASRGRIGGRAHLLWRSPEERGIALLIANLFRHDSQFRMGILTIIPVTILYVGIILFANRTPILDPFSAEGRAGFGSTILLYLAVGFFPTYVKSALTYSNQAEASWLFHSSPADRLLILRAARRFILLFFIAPYLLILGGVYAVLTREIVHTVQHFAAITLLVLIETDVLLLFFPQLPFSRPLTAGRRGAGALSRMLAGFVILLPIYLLVVLVYPHPAAYWASLAGLAVVFLALRELGKRHAAARLAREEFT